MIGSASAISKANSSVKIEGNIQISFSSVAKDVRSS
jgi:hypothetical protein